MIVVTIASQPASAQSKKKAAPKPAHVDELTKLRNEYVKLTNEYKSSLEKLISIYENNVKKAEDKLAQSNKKPRVESVGDKKVLKDDTHTIELYHIENLAHSDGMLVAFLPKEKILFSGDFNVPAAGQPVSPSIATLVQNVERLKLDFDRHVLVHPPNPDRPMTKADLLQLMKGTQ